MPSPTDPPRPPYELTWPGKHSPPLPSTAPLYLRDIHPATLPAHSDDPPIPNRLIAGDNLLVMGSLLGELHGKIDLIYLDPPFDAGQEFRMQVPLGDGNGVGRSRDEVLTSTAYRDIWGRGEHSYLQMLYDRLPLIRELLAETGSLFVHVNWRVSHLVQALLDEVFGAGERQGPGKPGFRCEVVWGYGGGTAVRNVYRRKHDNLFWYTRSDRWTFEPQYRPYSPGTRERGLTAVKGERYALREQGAALETWWTGPEVQKILSPTAYENWKYPTQKPEALLERIVRGHSRPGDLVADFFCGSGTTGAVATQLGRRWIMADASLLAVHTSRRRLSALQGSMAARDETPAPFTMWGAEADTSTGGELSAIRRRESNGEFTIELTGFTPGPIPAGETIAGGDTWKYLDYWAVDWDYRGEPFRHQWSTCRTPAHRRLELRSALYGSPGPRIAVKAIDVLGRETMTVIE